MKGSLQELSEGHWRAHNLAEAGTVGLVELRRPTFLVQGGGDEPDDRVYGLLRQLGAQPGDPALGRGPGQVPGVEGGVDPGLLVAVRPNGVLDGLQSADAGHFGA